MKVVMTLPPPGKQSRRGFLKRGLFGGVLLSLGGMGFLALRDGAELPLPPEGLRVLTPREFATVATLAETIIPPRRRFPPPDSVRTAFLADRLLARADPTVVEELRQLLGLFDNALAGLLLTGSTRPFSRLPVRERAEVLEDWAHSRLDVRRTGYHALRTLVLAVYYANPATFGALGYPGPPKGFHDPEAPVWLGGEAPP